MENHKQAQDLTTLAGSYKPKKENIIKLSKFLEDGSRDKSNTNNDNQHNVK